jgi:cytochrome c oxidase subunit 4
MTTATATDHVEAHDEHDDHMTDWKYVQVAALLGVLTGIEVFTYFESVLDWGKALVPVLLVLMVTKFYVVAAYFMHLKFDSRFFSRAFAGGLVLAMGVYAIFFAAFGVHFWEIFQD